MNPLRIFERRQPRKIETIKCPKLFRNVLKEWYGVEISSEEFTQMQHKVNQGNTTFIRNVPIIKKFREQSPREEHEIEWMFTSTNQTLAFVIVLDSKSKKIISARKPSFRKKEVL